MSGSRCLAAPSSRHSTLTLITTILREMQKRWPRQERVMQGWFPLTYYQQRGADQSMKEWHESPLVWVRCSHQEVKGKGSVHEEANTLTDVMRPSPDLTRLTNWRGAVATPLLFQYYKEWVVCDLCVTGNYGVRNNPRRQFTWLIQSLREGPHAGAL
jgi:hypothetical protein